MPNRDAPTPAGMTVPDASGTFRQRPLRSVAVSLPSGSIDQSQRDVQFPMLPTDMNTTQGEVLTGVS